MTGTHDDFRELGALLRSYRDSRGLSLRDVAGGAEISPSYLSDIENGRRSPRFTIVRRVAAALGIVVVLVPAGDLVRAESLAG